MLINWKINFPDMWNEMIMMLRKISERFFINNMIINNISINNRIKIFHPFGCLYFPDKNLCFLGSTLCIWRTISLVNNSNLLEFFNLLYKAVLGPAFSLASLEVYQFKIASRGWGQVDRVWSLQFYILGTKYSIKN